MNVSFTEEDGTVREWEKFRPGRLMSPEAEAIEKVTGMTFPQWGAALMNGSTIAGRALVWVLKKREAPALRFRDVVYPVESFLVSLDDEEKAKVWERLENDDSLTDEERDATRAALGDYEPEDGARPPAPTPTGSGTD